MISEMKYGYSTLESLTISIQYTIPFVYKISSAYFLWIKNCLNVFYSLGSFILSFMLSPTSRSVGMS